MLTESFVVSLGAASASARLDPSKDASIAIFEHQPIVQQRSAFKKSTTAPHCLASSPSHTFAAQIDKAVVHVYNRSKGNQEATVPFTEKISCITLVCNDTVLVLGTVEGRLFLWETATGRQITTTQSHLQAVTCLAVEGSCNFLVSTSADTTARVWALPTLLSFQTEVQSASPSKTYDAHRAPIKAVSLGHSASSRNVAVTISEDRACMIWDYNSTTTLYTFLLNAVPSCVDLDPADRAAYIGYDDGSVQQLDLLKAARSKSNAAVQPGDTRRWSTPDTSYGPIHSLTISFDGTAVLTGHQSGAILSWDTASGHMRPLPLHPPITRPVTGLQFLPIEGIKQSGQASYSIDTIVKPRFGAFQTGNLTVPGNYAAQIHLHANTAKDKSAFETALTAPVIPDLWLERGLQELAAWTQPVQHNSTDDFMAFSEDKPDASDALKQENEELRQQVAALQRVQSASFNKLDKLTAERNALLKQEQQRLLEQAMANDDD